MKNKKSLLIWILGGLGIALVAYAIVVGLRIQLPWRGSLLGQTARNLFYHVPMWFAMMALCLVSLVNSIRFLTSGQLKHDAAAAESAHVGVMFGILGLLTGIVWSRVTWGNAMLDSQFAAWWPWDPKQVGALIAVLIYAAYFILRLSFDEARTKARISAVYNIFSAASIIPLFYILPKVLGGLHPGSNEENATVVELSSEFRIVFWPAVLGFILIGLAIYLIRTRATQLEQRVLELE